MENIKTIKKNIFTDNNASVTKFNRIIRDVSNYLERNLYWDYAFVKYRYKISLTYETRLSANDKFRLAIVAIIKNEDDYLLEWIEFYRLQGVEHFFLYDNGCCDSTRELLSFYIESCIVTYARFPHVPNTKTSERDKFFIPSDQNLAYGECIRRFKSQVIWLLKVDLDEFIFPTVASGYDRLIEVVDFLEANDYCGFRVRMHDFGSSWHRNKPDGLVIENFTRCSRLPRWSSKSLARLDQVKSLPYSHPHRFFFKGGGLQFWKKVRILGEDETEGFLKLNHYRTKSLEECLMKADSNFMVGKYTEAKFLKNEADLNEVEDDGEILRYRDRVAAAVQAVRGVRCHA